MLLKRPPLRDAGRRYRQKQPADSATAVVSDSCSRPAPTALAPARCDPGSNGVMELPRSLDTTCTFGDDASVRGVVEAIVPQAAAGITEITVVSGGITNQLKKVVLAEGPSVLVRVFGAEGMIDREVENPTFQAVTAFLGENALAIETQLQSAGGPIVKPYVLRVALLLGFGVQGGRHTTAGSKMAAWKACVALAADLSPCRVCSLYLSPCCRTAVA